MTRPTIAHARRFGRLMRKWQRELNLVDWHIYPMRKRAKGGVYAQVDLIDIEARMAAYSLGNDWGEAEVNEQTLDSTALHEMLHIFLAELLTLTRDKNTSAEVLMSAEHRVIHVLEKLITKHAHTSN